MRPRDRLTRQDTERLDQVRLACQEITFACDLDRVFHDLMRDRRGADLAEWVRLAECEGPAPVRQLSALWPNCLALLGAHTLQALTNA